MAHESIHLNINRTSVNKYHREKKCINQGLEGGGGRGKGRGVQVWGQRTYLPHEIAHLITSPWNSSSLRKVIRKQELAGILRVHVATAVRSGSERAHPGGSRQALAFRRSLSRASRRPPSRAGAAARGAAGAALPGAGPEGRRRGAILKGASGKERGCRRPEGKWWAAAGEGGGQRAGLARQAFLSAGAGRWRRRPGWVGGRFRSGCRSVPTASVLRAARGLPRRGPGPGCGLRGCVSSPGLLGGGSSSGAKGRGGRCSGERRAAPDAAFSARAAAGPQAPSAFRLVAPAGRARIQTPRSRRGLSFCLLLPRLALRISPHPCFVRVTAVGNLLTQGFGLAPGLKVTVKSISFAWSGGFSFRCLMGWTPTLKNKVEN